MTTHVLGDTGVLLGRSLRHIFRSLDTIITVTLMPIMFLLLFRYVFGGAISAGTDNYVNYLMPGILLMAIASGITYTSYRLFLDLRSGIFERFHSMPLARSASRSSSAAGGMYRKGTECGNKYEEIKARTEEIQSR